jgi:hypothetical protein
MQIWKLEGQLLTACWIFLGLKWREKRGLTEGRYTHNALRIISAAGGQGATPGRPSRVSRTEQCTFPWLSRISSWRSPLLRRSLYLRTCPWDQGKQKYGYRKLSTQSHGEET